ncbi:MAG: lipase family protein, partial [Planctomycetota bacterium]
TMASLPMYFPPSPFNLAEALTCAELVATAYDMYTQWTKQGKPNQADKFAWTPTGPKIHYSQPIWGVATVLSIFKDPEPFGFAAWTDDGTVYLVYRGTESDADWADDLELDQRAYGIVPDYGRVHDGFLSLYETVQVASLEAINLAPAPRRLYFIGHSLGSALSTLAVPEVIACTGFKPGAQPLMHYNFASPRVGNAGFAAAYNQNGVPTYRVVNTCDLVPEVPAAALGESLFQHVGTPVDFTAQYNSIGGNHSLTGAYSYAINHPDQPQGPLANELA